MTLIEWMKANKGKARPRRGRKLNRLSDAEAAKWLTEALSIVERGYTAYTGDVVYNWRSGRVETPREVIEWLEKQ